jgi:hypothetical protein
VEVTAESQLEAGVMALATLRKAGLGRRFSRTWETAEGLEIEVREPSVIHHVTVAQLQRWASGTAKSPAERLKRERLRQMLASPIR